MKPHPIMFIVILLVTAAVIFKYYWRIQMMYNSAGVSFYTPSTFPFANEAVYENVVEVGYHAARTKKIVICSLLRDVEHIIPQIIMKTERTGALFSDYRILIVENDSSDNTRAKLIEWASNNPKVIVLGCGVNNPNKCSLTYAKQKTDGHSVYRTRIEKMVRLRNIYLQYVKEHFSNYEYMAVWDLDIVGTVYLDGILNTIGQFKINPQSNAICSYGVYRWGLLTVYYDTYAHLDVGEQFHIDNKLLHDVRKGLSIRHHRGEPMKKVDSCFSGFTIYRVSSLIKNGGMWYDMTPIEDGNLECEHVRLNKKLSGVYMNPSSIHFLLLNE